MNARFFIPEEKIKPTGLRYIVRKHDVELGSHSAKSEFCGVDLVFDCQDNLIVFKDQLNKLPKPQIQALSSTHATFGDLNKINESFCNISIVPDSETDATSKQNRNIHLGSLLFKALEENVELSNTPSCDFDCQTGEFILPAQEQEVDFSDAPKYMICPISLELLKDPITLSNGITYDRHSLMAWLIRSHYQNSSTKLLCPKTKTEIPIHELKFQTNVILKNLISEYKAKKIALLEEAKRIEKANDIFGCVIS